MSSAWPVDWLAEIDSTNLEARRRAKPGFANQWIAAHVQTSGRGRMGRTWASPQGNLYATALFRWGMPIAMMTRLPFAAALAVTDTVNALAPDTHTPPRLKWPNDVRCNGAKISGILVETGETAETRWAAVGIGMNIKFVPKGIDQLGTCLSDLRGNDKLDPEMVLDTLREKFAIRLEEAVSNFGETRSAWLLHAEGLGKKVRITSADMPLEGVFADMAEDGALILQLPDGSEQIIRAGDVELIREVTTD